MKAIYFNDFDTSYIPDILTEIYIHKIYQKYFSGLKDLTILDVGANIGLFSFYTYPFAKKIYALEPAKEHVEVMNAMLKQNEMLDKVTVVQKALSNTDGEATFYHNENVTMFSLKAEVNSQPDKSETVKTIRLDSLCKEYNIDNIDFLKLDTEGAENDIIMSEGFANIAPRIKTIVGEWHSWSKTNKMQIINTLRDLGFQATYINKTNATIFEAIRL